MAGDFLLDTNIAILFMASDPTVRARVESAGSIAVSFAALGELYFGAFKSARRAENLSRVEQFRRDVPVIGWDSETARQYGEIKKRLRDRGRPIPDNDIWIAAVALRNDLILATRDGHFDEVEGLTVDHWSS